MWVRTSSSEGRRVSALACVSVMFFREGISLGSRDFFPRLGLDADAATVIGSFLGQYYLERPVPSELILSHAPEDMGLLSEALGEHAGHKVELKASVRSDRARFLDMAVTNSAAALAYRPASASMRPCSM